ncbi:hypothetical protein, partial [Sphingorhabdus sp.]|jgi:hypothetical protein|uniref:hypothetical protein n=1 Tax=Sphingorhabdus sp. TaxID=1902408 RepID=UPI0039BD22AB
MIDLRGTIKPKSDQLNADDLIGGPVTIRITGVAVGEGEQPVSISFDGDGGKPFKPGKSMRRVLVNLWGPDGAAYIGRSLTIYRDEQVVFGGVEVGGIRISHMSHLQRETTMALTATKAKRKPFTVRPLVVEKPADKAAIAVDALLARIAAGEDVTGDAKVAEQRAWLAKNRPELAEKINAALSEPAAEEIAQ